MRVTIGRREHRNGVLASFLVPKIQYIVDVDIRFSDLETKVIRDHGLGDYNFFIYIDRGYESPRFVKDFLTGSRVWEHAFKDFADANRFEAEVRTNVSRLKQMIEALEEPTTASETFEL